MEPRETTRAAARWIKLSLLTVGMVIGLSGVSCTPGTVDSSSQVLANDVPVLTFTKPNMNTTAYTGQSVTITFFASDDDDPITVKLYYDRDGLPASGDEQLLMQFQKAARDYSSNTYSWSTSDLALGLYHILAIVDDGHNPPVTVYNSYTVTIESSTPTLTVTEPFGPTSVVPAQNVVIKWTQSAPLGASTVTLFYDNDQNYANGTVATILTRTEPAGSTGDSYVWNVPAVRSGRYCLGATLDDGTHPRVVAYANGYLDIAGPSVQVINPAADVQWHSGGSLGIRYTVVTYRPGGSLRLFYDQDGVANSGDETYLVTLPLVNGTATWTWTSGAMLKGTYHIGAEINDGLNDPVVDYAPGLVRELGPTVNVTAPAGLVQWYGGGSTVVTYTALSQNAQATIFRDGDGVANTGDEVTLLGPQAVQNAVATSWTWTSGPLSGTIHVGVKVDDGVNPPAYGYAPGTIQDNGPSLQITAPAGPVSLGAGSVLPISWNYQCAGMASNVRIFYDTNTSYDPATDNPRTIVQKTEPAGSGTDTTNWTVPLITAGTYYIGGVLTAGSFTVVAYATGPLAITGPTLNLTSPAVDIRVLPGSNVTISWSNQLPAGTTITLFYDTDQNDANGTSGNIVVDLATDPTKVGDSYVWTIPSSLTNPPPPLVGWYIGATATDALSQTATAYAAGRVIILDRTFFSYPLDQVESLGLGRTFRGFSPNGQLGKVAAQVPWKFVTDPKDPTGVLLRAQPGIDMNADSYDDFLMTAPTGNPFYLERVGAGESYLVLSDPAKLFTPPTIGPFLPMPVSATGTSKLPGALFSGPAFTSSSLGIGAAALSRTVAQDGQPAILFGMPRVSNGVQEEQDYDPWDQLEYTTEQAFNTQASPVHFYTSFNDTYRQPTLSNTRNPDGIATDRAQSGWNNITAGMVVAVSGANPPLRGATTNQVVVPLDNVGQLSPDPHPTVVSPSLNGAGNGVRLYCPWMFNSFHSPTYVPRYPYTVIAGQGDNGVDNSRFGESIVEADLDGDGNPEWIITQPQDHTSGAYDQGWLHVQWTVGSRLWTDPIAAGSVWLPWTSVWTIYINTVTITNTGTTSTGPVLVAVAPATTDDFTNGTRVWSWPYCLAMRSGRLDLTLTIDQTVTPNVYTWAKTGDTRDRAYAWPMLSDYLRGDVNDAATGTLAAHLGGLSNVGDFNGDGREDITVGAPNGRPGGKANAGCVYLIFGRGSFGDNDLSSIGLQTPGALAGIKIRGDNAGDLVGTSQASAGDFNGDGYSDWLIGAPGYNGGAGLAAIIYGTPLLQGAFNVSDIGTAKLPGVIFTGEAAAGGAGACVAGVGDVDGDGYDDVAVVAPNMDWTFFDGTSRTKPGVVYLIYGGPDYTGTMTLGDVAKGNLPGLIYAGPHDNEAVTTVAPAGDVDNDGLADFLIGCPNYNILDPSGATLVPKVGEVYLIRGAARIVP